MASFILSQLANVVAIFCEMPPHVTNLCVMMAEFAATGTVRGWKRGLLRLRVLCGEDWGVRCTGDVAVRSVEVMCLYNAMSDGLLSVEMAFAV